MSPGSPRTLPSERCYRALLRLTPPDFRADAGDEMVAVFRDGHREAVAARSLIALPRFWLYAIRDVLKTRRDLRRGLPALYPPRSSSPGPRRMIEGTLEDLRFATRSLLRAPGFAAVVVLTLALGIGANTAIFSVVDGILLRPLPFPEPDRLVAVWADYSGRSGPEREWLSFPNFHDLRQHGDTFEALSTYNSWGPTLVRDGSEPELLTGAFVTHGMLTRVLGITPVLGRGLLPEDDVFDAPPVVLISHGLWTRSFESDPGILGRSINLNGVPTTVVGVTPAGLRPPFIPRAEVWRPTGADPTQTPRGDASFRALGRLAAGTDLATARALADTLGQRLEIEFPGANTGVGYTLAPLREDIVTGASAALWMLLAAVGFVLLMACVNVANLLLAQATSRRGELAVRAALGASRRRVVQQLLAESILLALLGGSLGTLLGVAGTRMLVELVPAGTPRIDEVAVDLRVLAFTAAATLASALVFGLLPALRTASADLHDALKEGGRSADAGAHGRRLRAGLVVLQVALALVLLVGAGLLVRTFQRLTAVDLGFDRDGILAVSLNLPAARYRERPAQTAFYQELERRLAALPGVIEAGAVNSLPLAGNDGDANFRIEGQAPPPPETPQVAWIRRATPGYQKAIGLQLSAGRFFDARDDSEAARVVVINETLARRFFPDEEPVGKRVYFGSANDPDYRMIIGVASDIKNFSIAGTSRNAIYFPYAQVPTGFMTLVLRTSGDPAQMIPAVRRQIATLDELLAASNIATMDTVVSASLATERFVTTLMSAFALVAMALAVVGLYGVVSYGVSMRRHEMGVRMALGARGPDIGRLVIGGSVALVGIGVAVGVLGALAMTRFLDGLLFGIGSTDPLTFAAVIVLLGGAGFVAALIPAARATRVDPVTVLNPE